MAPTGVSVDMAIRLQEETGMEVDIEEYEEEEEEEEVMPTSKYPALVESPFVTGVIETLPIGDKLRDAWEAERRLAGAMVQLARVQEVSLWAAVKENEFLKRRLADTEGARAVAVEQAGALRVEYQQEKIGRAHV